MARPVILVAISSDLVRDPIARNNEYMVIVMIHSMRRLMKNCEAVLESPAILFGVSIPPISQCNEPRGTHWEWILLRHPKSTHQYTTMSKMRTCTKTSGASTTVCAIAYAAGLWKELIAYN